MRARPLTVAVLALPLHVALALSTDLSPDEAYYLAIARRSPLLLVDHPPLFPALLAVTDRLKMLPLELRTRLVPMACAFVVTLLAARVARARGAGDDGATFAALIASFALLPTVGGFIATPDGPMAVAFLVALASSSPVVLFFAAFAGALSKVVMFPIAVALAFDATKSARARYAAGAGALAALPLASVSLSFQLRHAFVERAPSGWSASAAAAALASIPLTQAMVWSPWLLARAPSFVKTAKPIDRVVAIGLVGLVAASALLRGVPPEANWLAPAALLMLVATSRDADRRPLARRLSIAFALATTALAGSHALRPWLPIPIARDPTARLHGWKTATPPSDAPGVGAYGSAAERCVYANACADLESFLRSR